MSGRRLGPGACRATGWSRASSARFASQRIRDRPADDVAVTRDPEGLADRGDRSLGLGGDKVHVCGHDMPSLAKSAVAFRRISRSWRSFRFSRRSAANASRSAVNRGTCAPTTRIDLRPPTPPRDRAVAMAEIDRDRARRLPGLLAEPNDLGLVFGGESPSFSGWLRLRHASEHPFALSELSKKTEQGRGIILAWRETDRHRRDGSDRG